MIEVEFDFEAYSLNFGRVKLVEPVSKRVMLLVKDPESVQVTEFTTSSSYVTAQTVPSPPAEGGLPKMAVEVTLLPGIPPGKITETITAHSNLESKPQAMLRLTGTILGDVEITPEAIRFDRYQSDSAKTTRVQQLQIVNSAEDRPLQVLSFEDPDGRLQLELNTLEAGQKYEITATLNEDVLKEGKYLRGSIIISTDNPEQQTVTASYLIYNRP